MLDGIAVLVGSMHAVMLQLALTACNRPHCDNAGDVLHSCRHIINLLLCFCTALQCAKLL